MVVREERKEMKTKLSVVLALVIAGIFPAASLYAWHRSSNPPGGPESARDAAIDFVIENHPELRSLRIPTSWETKDMNPDRIPGISKLRYIGPGWSVNVTNPVVLHPTYTIMIDCTVEEGFYWEGTVDQDGKVHEFLYARWHLISPTEL